MSRSLATRPMLDGRSASEVAQEHGVSRQTFHERIKSGWGVREAATVPPRKRAPPKPPPEGAVTAPTDARVHHVLDGRAAVEVAREHGIKPETFRSRVDLLGWDVKRAATTPVRGTRRP